ncbi:MAG: RNA polymerase sigma factor [Crocinitomicaceae bacterium]
MLQILRISDSKIVEYLQEGGRKESRAIQQLLDQNRSKISSYVLKNSGNSSDAETILVEGVTELVFNIRKDKFRGDSTLSTYLFAICRSVWLKSLKKNKRYADDDEIVLMEDTADSPLQLFNEQQIKAEVSYLLSSVGEACKKVLEMWSQHYSMQDISVQLGYKNSQIAMNKKNRCLTKLKEVVKDNASHRELLLSYLN